MKTFNTLKPFYYFSLLIILILCIGLFLLDKDTRSFADLLKRSNLFALAIYVIPTYFICAALYYFLDNRNKKYSTSLALTIGVPIGFTLVIVVLSALMGRL
jgi:prolipoprotein diacylglyceryltransferase